VGAPDELTEFEDEKPVLRRRAVVGRYDYYP
jgi:hypothetical protein